MTLYFPDIPMVVTGEAGRLLEERHNYTRAKGLLLAGEHLYIMCVGDNFRHLACIDDRADFNRFWVEYMNHHFSSYRFYALNEEEHQAAR